jgi:hypothetical protein
MRISASFHHDSRRDSLSNDIVRETIRKISFKPTSRESSHPGQVDTGPPGTKRGTEPTARPGASAQLALVIGTHNPVADLSQQRIKRCPVLGGLINEYERPE